LVALPAAALFAVAAFAAGPPATELEKMLTTPDEAIVTERAELFSCGCQFRPCFLRLSRLRVTVASREVSGLELWTTHASALIDADEIPRMRAALSRIASSDSGSVTFVTRDGVRISLGGPQEAIISFNRESYFVQPDSRTGGIVVTITAQDFRKMIAAIPDNGQPAR
jgi:hypothetical protein